MVACNYITTKQTNYNEVLGRLRKDLGAKYGLWSLAIYSGAIHNHPTLA